MTPSEIAHEQHLIEDAKQTIEELLEQELDGEDEMPPDEEIAKMAQAAVDIYFDDAIRAACWDDAIEKAMVGRMGVTKE